MGHGKDVDRLVRRYWKIIKVAHDPVTKDFLSQCQSQSVYANGKSYEYYQRGRGPTVLLIHGLHSNLGRMVPIARSLVEQDYRVVLFDAPAHGEAAGSSTDPFEVRELIRAICDRVGELHAIIGHSLGGLWALCAWNGNVRAKKFVSISTPSDQMFLVEKFAEMQAIDAGLVQELVREIENHLGKEVWTEYSPSEIAKTINIRGLIIHGANDDFVPPKHAVDLHANWHQSTLKLVEGAGHTDIVRAQEVLTLISTYLQEVE